MRFLLRNWHLKLAAVVGSTILYTGLVFSGTLSEQTLQVPVVQVNQPPDSFNLTGDLGFVEVRYRTDSDGVGSVRAEAFVARVDLSQYDMSRAPEPQVLEVTVSADGLQVLEVTPPTKRVELDRNETRSVPVEVETGEIPAGLEIGEPELSELDGQVEVRGPASEVSRVDRALARILIDPSGIDFNQPVELVPVDIEGQPVGIGRLELSPEVISVTVDVETVETTKTVPVTQDIVGTPAPGYALEALAVQPSTVTLRGLPEVLAPITEVRTEPIDIGGISETQTFEVALVLPEETRLALAGAEALVTVEATIGLSVGSRSFVLGLVCQGAGTNGCQPSIQQLTLTLGGPSDVLRALGAADLTPFVDVSGLAPGIYTLTPLIPALPDGVEILQLVPGTVSVRVVAQALPTPTPAP
ncbi:MAG TPA: CdaR family protein [Candidatus Limnocylindria bacterium]